jgi:alkylation response protein AidB-like acyl-CoA dehydrogenase
VRDALDERLSVLDDHCREIAADLRPAGAAIDRDPEAITEYLHLPAVDILRRQLAPSDAAGYRIGRHSYRGLSCIERVIIHERLSYGDPGVVLASPGPSMSGVVVRALGDQRQQDAYVQRLAAAPTWTFFALTEPGKGSAATELETTLEPDGDGYRLRGHKRYIGNGAHAQLGVVFCRRAPGPLGIEAVLVDSSAPGFRAQLLPTIGLRGARLSQLEFDAVRIAPSSVLGRDRPPSRRGLLGAIHTLLHFRPGVAAIALGVAQAALDYAVTQRSALPRHDRLRAEDVGIRIAAVRRLSYRVAADIDRGMVNPHRISAAKLRAARLAEESTLLAAELLGPASLIEHPWLEKTYRDARAFEFMEGAGDIQRLSVFQGVLKGTSFVA